MGRFDRKTVAARKAGEPGDRPPSGTLRDNPELDRVGAWLAEVTFRKRLLGGLDPEDVWKKLEELNALYENALIAERARYSLLIRQLRLGAQEDGDG